MLQSSSCVSVFVNLVQFQDLKDEEAKERKSSCSHNPRCKGQASMKADGAETFAMLLLLFFSGC